MAIKILSCESEREWAERVGYPVITGNMLDYVDKYDKDIIIRWGYSRFNNNRAGSKVEFKNIINKGANIRTNCEKSNALKLMSQVVNVPTLWEKKVPAEVLAVVRTHEHSGGHGFSVKKGPFDVQSGTYATRFIQTDAEYRVWFCGNRTMCGRRAKMACNEDQEYPCRSRWGYIFMDGIAKDLRTQTLLAAKKIGLEFGAADVLYFKGKWYFLELNSAPSVDHRVVREFYQAAFKVLIDKKFPNKDGVLIPVIEVKSDEDLKKKSNKFNSISESRESGIQTESQPVVEEVLPFAPIPLAVGV